MMRRLKAERRSSYLLTILLVLCIVLFIENRIEAFMPQLKGFAEEQASSELGGKLKLSIGHINGGIFHPFVLNDVVIRDGGKMPFFPRLEINNIRTQYRIWDFIRAKRSPGIEEILPKDSSVYVNFLLRAYGIRGFLSLQGDMSRPKVKGYLFLRNGKRVDFTAVIKDESLEADIKTRTGTYKTELIVSDDGIVTLKLKTGHINISGFDLVLEGVARSRIVSVGESSGSMSVEGDFETTSLILNYKPFLNLKGAFNLSGGELNISDLCLGDGLKARAKVTLGKPYLIDAVLTMNNISISWLMNSLDIKDGTSILSGTANSRLSLKGPAKSPRVDMELDVKKGTISTLDFENLSATFKGDFPFIRIEESRISRESGYFVLAGELDMTKFGKASFFDDIKIVTDERAISWDSLDTSKGNQYSELRMKKRLNDQMNLDFKKYISEDKIGEGIAAADEVQLEYKLHQHESLKMVFGPDKDFIGLEHKDKF